MPTNHLPDIVAAYTTAQESLRAVKLIVNDKSHYPRLVAKLPTLLGSPDPKENLNKSLREIEDLFVLNLWATFERALRDYLQDKGNALKNTAPEELGVELYAHFEKQVEYWKPDDMLEIVKKSLFADSPGNQGLVGHAKQIIEYRNWIAHGRNPDKMPSATVTPRAAYDTLNALIKVLPAS